MTPAQRYAVQLIERYTGKRFSGYNVSQFIAANELEYENAKAIEAAIRRVKQGDKEVDTRFLAV